MEIEVPRDRNGRVEPQILPKHERRFTGFDDKIIPMYSRGISTRDIQAHLMEIYGVEVSAGFVGEVTDAAMEDGAPGRVGPLEPNTEVQLCIVHVVRNSLAYVSWKDRKRVAADLKLIYRGTTAEQCQRSAPPALRPACSAWARLPAAGWRWGTASCTQFKTVPSGFTTNPPGNVILASQRVPRAPS